MYKHLSSFMDDPEPNGSGPGLLSVYEAAERLGVSSFFIRREIARGKLGCHRLGRRIYVSQKDMAEYLERVRVAPCLHGES